MVKYEKFVADNGLRVLVHEDKTTPLVALNLLYDVGSKDEDPGVTGLAHLFEHLMFSGTENIPDFDTPLQLAGGENNAFTNTDITNYYITVPKDNIETAFWLEADRMNEINLSDKNIKIQKNVVTEEYKQRYLNQPYGDAMLILRKLSYAVHPYRWPTIGADIAHVRDAEKKTITNFYYSHYAPNNAILCLSGNITLDESKRLVDKWFGKIPRRAVNKRELPLEPPQTGAKRKTVNRNVPATALYKAWHGERRDSKFFPVLDMLTDILAGGDSGYLQNILVRDKKLFSNANIYVTAELEPGQLIFSGKLLPGVDLNEADDAVNEIISQLSTTPPSDYDIEKVKNRYEASNALGLTNILNKAMDLCLFELMGDANLINKEVDRYRAISKEDVVDASRKYLNSDNCSTLVYLNSVKKR